ARGERRQALLARLAHAGALAVRDRRFGHVSQQVVGLERAGVGILVLEQEPLRLPRRLARAHQVPPAPELVAKELEAQVALRELVLRIALRSPDATVEARHVSPAVLALRDLAFEAGIAHRVVLDLDRHALDT